MPSNTSFQLQEHSVNQLFGSNSCSVVSVPISCFGSQRLSYLIRLFWWTIWLLFVCLSGGYNVTWRQRYCSTPKKQWKESCAVSRTSRTRLQELEYSAGPDYQCLQRPVPPQELRILAGALRRRREREVFELSVYGGSKGWEVTVELFGREVTRTGRDFVWELYEESVSPSSTTSLLWTAWWMDLRDLRHIWQERIISTDGCFIPDVHSL